ncbi:type VII secretion target [Mycolicibacterium fortuitum]|uniref:type VII secretion target n=1 Tax=Mycolicibacterium fortuitum TaxID=1766 RepID=UPI00262A07C5|nr:type VII secretion target [Mycolicibacterium fortuitum]
MANDLRVDPGALRAGATSSEMIAAELGNAPAIPDAGHYPSSTGVIAMDGAVVTARASQASRVSAQAGDLSAAAQRYSAVDEQNAGGLAELM